MTMLVIFVEEASAEIVVQELARRLAPNIRTIVIPHSGKTDLKASFPRKIQAWQQYAETYFMVVHDNDGANCRDLKQTLVALIPAGQKSRSIVRIVVQELEAWYLGDLHAMAEAGLIASVRAEQLSRKRKFRDPDVMTNAKQEFLKLHDQVGQRLLARQIAPHMDPDRNSSRSFQVFARTLRELSARSFD